MFGYVVADQTRMTDGEFQRYRQCYCGLCRAIEENYGQTKCLALNYDMAFLVLLLSALYEPEEIHFEGRCIAHPLHKHLDWQTEITYYAAAMNIALAYHNCMDNWHDEKSLTALAQAAIFKNDVMDIADAYPRQWSAIEQGLKTLNEIEKNNLQEPDAGANAFGQLMGELFVYREDHWAPYLRRLGQALGRFIYLMDAVLDLPKDTKKGQYNPFTELASDHRDKESFRPMLSILIGEATEAFEQLPLIQDLAILRNILYSGVWARFYSSDRKSNKEGKDV